MPDFTIETYWICRTARGGSWQVNGHTVTYGHNLNPRYGAPEYDYACDQECKGFKYRHDCRHVQKAKTLHCNWQQFIDGGEPAAGQRCPRCGDALEAERYAV